MIWKPHVTVAAVIEQNGRFLLVEEQTDDGILFNQPAGHLDPGESLVMAVIRETLEESAHHFQPETLVGVYHWHQTAHDRTYLRFAFSGNITGSEPHRVLDAGILRTVWQTPEEMRALQTRHRSPLVMRCVDDYLTGKRYPLALLTHYA